MKDRSDLQFLNITDPAWLEFSCRQIGTGPFQHPAWSETIAQSYQFLPFIAALMDNKGGIICATPIMEVKGVLRGNRWISLPFSDYCAPCTTDPAALSYFSQQLIRVAARSSINTVEIRWQMPDFYPVNGEFVLTSLSLDAGPDVVARKIKKVDFRNIRVAETRGVRVSREVSLTAVDTFYKLHSQNRHRLGIPVQPRRFFNSLYEKMIAKNLGAVWLAQKDGQAVGAVVEIHWNKQIIYKYAALTLEGRSLLAGDFILWKIISWGCSEGYSELNFGRSDIPDTGLRQYKRRWGGIEQPLAYSYSRPQGKTLDSGWLKSTARFIFRHSPAWFGEAAGSVLYRYSA